MGTSNPYGGPGSKTPLVPTWLDSDGDTGQPPEGPDGDSSGSDGGDGGPQPQPPEQPVSAPSLPSPPPIPTRFQAPRANFTHFVRSGGRNRAALGRALSGYVSAGVGGAANATRRMGAARTTGANLLGFLSDVRSRGVVAALRTLKLETLAGRPIDEVFLGLVDFVCPDGGTIDEGIAREAFIETIADLAAQGITDLDGLSLEEMEAVFELYVTHAIEARVFNDIGIKGVALPADAQAATRIQSQLHDFTLRAVSDALAAARATLQALTPDRLLAFVEGIYETAFSILRATGEAEGGKR